MFLGFRALGLQGFQVLGVRVFGYAPLKQSDLLPCESP